MILYESITTNAKTLHVRTLSLKITPPYPTLFFSLSRNLPGAVAERDKNVGSSNPAPPAPWKNHVHAPEAWQLYISKFTAETSLTQTLFGTVGEPGIVKL